jgi:hypothetical protein
VRVTVFDPYALSRLLERGGLQLVPVAPPYSFRVYMFRIDVRDRGIDVSYGGYEVWRRRLPFDTNAVYDAVRSGVNTLRAYVIEPQRFLQFVYESYTALGDGQAPIVPMMNMFVSHYPLPYPRITFSYNLYNLNGYRSYDGKWLNLLTATIGESKDPSKWLWVPRNEMGEGNLFSYIVFR